jgi:hypothetical protein
MTTPILELDDWLSAQAQPEVVVNDAHRWLECFAALVVQSQSVTTPPSAVDGDRYIVGAGATGSWSGHDGQIALAIAGAWRFKSAPEGAIAYVQDETASFRYLSGTWTLEASGGGGGSQPYMVGGSILLSAPSSPRFLIPLGGTITQWALHAEGGPGDCVLDVRRSNAGAGNPPSGPGDSITGGASPFLSAEVGRNEAPSGGWSADLDDFDVLEFVLTSVDTNITALHFQIHITP